MREEETKGLSKRLHITNAYTWLVVTSGAFIFFKSLEGFYVSQIDLPVLVVAALTTISIAILAVRYPRLKMSVTVSDTIIFLMILIYDRDAAIMLAAARAVITSLRFSREPVMLAFQAASTAWATFLTAQVVCFWLAPPTGSISGKGPVPLMAVVCAMASVHYVANIGINTIRWALERTMSEWKENALHTLIGNFVSAAVAVAIAGYTGFFGFYAFTAVMLVIVIVAIICYSYVSYHQNIKASLAQTERAELYLTELQESEERYRHSFERFRSAFNNAPIGMALVAPFGGWLQVNRSLCEILGYSQEEMLTMSYQTMIHHKDCYNFLYNAKQVMTGALQTYQLETRFIHRLGHEVWVLVSVSPDSDPVSKAKHLIFQIQDITDRKRAEQQLRHEAFHDALTGLPNRAWFMEHLKAALEQRSETHSRPFAVLFLDLDRFKIINDSLGHMVGDELLVGIAERLKGCLGPADAVARLGGDEFTILLADGESAAELAERIHREVAQPFNLDGYEAFTTASIGIAVSGPDYRHPEDLLRDADTAMYHAKSQGKARHAVFDPCMHAHAMSQLHMESDLRRAIDRKEFFIEYQPIVSLAAQRLVGFEALVRWQHPELGLIVPEKFIGMAEEAGFIIPIGQWVLHEACRQMRRWQLASPGYLPLTMSVNISSKQFGHPNLVEQIIQAIEMNNLDPQTLKLEITESVVMESIETATDVLEQLRALGIGVSIDDFGTGYSSLSYLHRLPIDTLKIDRSFVSHLGLNNDNKEIVRTIIILAQNLGMEVVAEGVETEEQHERLKELKCHNGQGYLFGRPLGEKAAERLICNLDDRHKGLSRIAVPSRTPLSSQVAATYAM